MLDKTRSNLAVVDVKMEMTAYINRLDFLTEKLKNLDHQPECLINQNE